MHSNQAIKTMKSIKIYYIGITLLFTLNACVETEIVPETLTPTVSLNPASVSMTVGQTTQLNAVFTDEKGENRSAELQWRSSATNIVTIANSGFVTGVAQGQAWVIVSARGTLTDSTLVTVTSNPNQVAKVEIAAAQNALTIGGTLQFTSTIQNSAGQNLTGKTITWSSSNPTVLSINTNGLATANAAGTAQVRATVEGSASLPFEVTVAAVNAVTTRSGAFRGNSSYNVQGTATLEQQGSSLKLIFGTDFRSSNGPRLGVYLAKNAPGVLNSTNSVNLGDLKSTSGKQEYNVPDNVKLSDYDYAVVYCIPFNVAFGYAKLQ